VENLYIEIIVVVGNGQIWIADIDDMTIDIVLFILAETIYIATHLDIVEKFLVHFKATLMVELSVGLFIVEYLAEILFKFLFGHSE
jgi:hypothetical protein